MVLAYLNKPPGNSQGMFYNAKLKNKNREDFKASFFTIHKTDSFREPQIYVSNLFRVLRFEIWRQLQILWSLSSIALCDKFKNASNIICLEKYCSIYWECRRVGGNFRQRGNPLPLGIDFEI